jgi:hypothetical protein
LVDGNDPGFGEGFARSQRIGAAVRRAWIETFDRDGAPGRQRDADTPPTRPPPARSVDSLEPYALDLNNVHPRPSRAFDRTGTLDDLRDGYRLMNDREVLNFQIAL